MNTRRTSGHAHYRSAAWFILLLLFCVTFPATTPAQAATIIEVTSGEDPPTPSASQGCTLRSAIIAANERRAEQDCPPGGIETTIVLPPFAGRLELSSCLPKIMANVTISGTSAQRFTISAQAYNSAGDNQEPPCRIFFVESGQVRFEHLIISGGIARGGKGGAGENGGGGAGGGAGMGGGIFINSGTVTLNNVLIEGNRAEGGAGGPGSLEGDVDGGGGGGGGARFAGEDGRSEQGGNGGGGGALYYSDAENQGGGGGGFVGAAAEDRNGSAGNDGGGGGGGRPCPGSPSGNGGFPGYGAGGGGSGGCTGGQAGFGGAGGFGGGAGGAGARLFTGSGAAESGGNESVAYGGGSGNGNNTTGGGGGGGAGLGGGIFVRTGTLVIYNTTFTDNTASPGSAGAGVPGGNGGQPGQNVGTAIFADNAARVSFGQGNEADSISPIPINDPGNITLIRSAFINPSVPVVTVSAQPSPETTSGDVVGSFTLNFAPRPTSSIIVSYALDGTASPEHYTSDPALQPGGGALTVTPAQIDADGKITITITRKPGNLSSGRSLSLRLLPTANYVLGERASGFLMISPGIPPWLILLYIAGDDVVPERAGGNPNLVRSLSEPMNALVNRLTATLPHSDTYRLVVFTDGNQPGDSRLYVSDPTPLDATLDEPGPGLQELSAAQLPSWFPVNRELDMGRASTLQTFVRWSKEQYAGYRYSMLSIIGHGGGWAQDIESIPQPARSNAFLAGGWRGLSVDTGSVIEVAPETPVGLSSLSTLDTGQVFAGLGDFGRFDVLFFDACLMGMAEALYEVRNYTDYIIAGENILWGQLPYEDYLGGISLTTKPEDLATHIVGVYNKAAPENEPFVIAAVKANQLDGIRAQLDDLSAKLLADLTDPQRSEATRTLIRDVYNDVQKLDYNADLEIDEDTDGYVDLAHMALLIAAASSDDEIKASAQELNRLITGSAVVTLTRRLAPGPVAQLNTTWGLTNTYGLSIYFPMGEEDCRPTTTTNDPNASTWRCNSLRPEWAEQPARLPQLVYERQLDAYLDTRNLSLVRHAPNWKELLTWLDENVAVRNNVSPSYTPFQVTGRSRVYLPVVENLRLADLSGSISFSPAGPTFRADQQVKVTVTVTNTGPGVARPFWVELYINPRERPTGPNQRWPELCRTTDASCFGIVWEFAEGLRPGESRSLDASIDNNGPQTVWPGCFAAGTRELYLSIDSWDPGVPYGRVQELSESDNIVPITITVLPAAEGSTCANRLR